MNTTPKPVYPEPPRLFGLNNDERKALNNWLGEHDTTCTYARNQGASGGRLTYQFTPTSLGMITTVHCTCGAHVDVTNYDTF
jgi:hypothetical protein